MGKMDLSHVKNPARRRREGMLSKKKTPFRKRMPPAAQRHVFIRRNALWTQEEAPVNPERTEIEDRNALTLDMKNLARDFGADVVGVAEYNSDLLFQDAGKKEHTCVLIFGMTMKYDQMVDIGPRSQDEVHRVYYNLDDTAVRLSHHIGAYGYEAKIQHNGGDFPLPAMAYMAGLGELGKHGSLISPKYGSSLRLGAVSTDMPLVVDGPRDFDMDKVCTSCRICERFCPGDAIKPQKKTVNGVERWYVDTSQCEPWFLKMHGCKICLMVCPFNAKGVLKDAFKPVAKIIRETKEAKGLLDYIKDKSGVDYEKVDPGERASDGTD